MGVYIANMQKPNDCIYCNMYNGEWYDEELGIEFDCMVKDDQADKCPLIEVDIVRCGECKYYDTTSRSFPCCTDIYGAVRHMEADDFCSKGERREDFPYLFKDIVTCGECKHVRRNPHDRPYCSLVDRTTRDECFCYWGERKKE